MICPAIQKKEKTEKKEEKEREQRERFRGPRIQAGLGETTQQDPSLETQSFKRRFLTNYIAKNLRDASYMFLSDFLQLRGLCSLRGWWETGYGS